MIFFSLTWSKPSFALPGATKWSQGGISQGRTNGTFLSDPDLFFLSQRKNKINEFQTIPRMNAVHSLRLALSTKLKIYKDLVGPSLSEPFGFLLVVVGAMAK